MLSVWGLAESGCRQGRRILRRLREARAAQPAALDPELSVQDTAHSTPFSTPRSSAPSALPDLSQPSELLTAASAATATSSRPSSSATAESSGWAAESWLGGEEEDATILCDSASACPTAGPSVSGDASTLGPYSDESDSVASDELSWATAAEEAEALDPARVGASPSSGPILRHLDFAVADGTYDSPALVIPAGKTTVALLFRNATQHRLSVRAELRIPASVLGLARDRLATRFLFRRRPADAKLELPTVSLEPESGLLGPGEQGCLTLHTHHSDIYTGNLADEQGASMQAELWTQAVGGGSEQMEEVPIFASRMPIAEARCRGPRIYVPHSPRVDLSFLVSVAEPTWVRLRGGRDLEVVGWGRGWWLALPREGLRATVRLATPFGRALEPSTIEFGVVQLTEELGEAIFASQEDVDELALLRGEVWESRAQDLADLAYHTLPPEFRPAPVSFTVSLYTRSALETSPRTVLWVPAGPGAAELRLRALATSASLAWTATAPAGFVCRPSEGVLEPGARAGVEVQAEAPTEAPAEGPTEAPTEAPAKGPAEEGSAPRHLVVRFGYLPGEAGEERAAAAAAPGDFVRQEERLHPGRVHSLLLTLARPTV